MQKNIEIQNTDTAYNALVEQIAEIVAQSRMRAVRAVNSEFPNFQAMLGNLNWTQLLKFFALDMNTEGDNPPIGIILAADKNDVMVKYATYGMDSNLFVAKYKFYLPEVNELKALVLAEMDKLSKK